MMSKAIFFTVVAVTQVAGVKPRISDGARKLAEVCRKTPDFSIQFHFIFRLILQRYVVPINNSVLVVKKKQNENCIFKKKIQ